MKVRCLLIIAGRLSLALITTLLFAATLQAQQQAGATPQPVLNPGDVELAQSRALVRVGATGLGHEHGVEGQLASGHVTLGAAQNAGQLVFDMKTFVSETSFARKYVGLTEEVDRAMADSVTKNMQGAEVLNVAKFPYATFDIASALPNGQPQPDRPQQFILDGKLTLRGVSQPLRLVCEVQQEQGWNHVRGGFTILQTKFGITPLTNVFGAVGVADELKIWGDLWVR